MVPKQCRLDKDHAYTHLRTRWDEVKTYQISGAAEFHPGQIHAMEKVAGLCRPLFPLLQREMPGNTLQDLLRKAEQMRDLQRKKFISNVLRQCISCLAWLNGGDVL